MSRNRSTGALVALLTLVVGCDDSTGFDLSPQLVSDTVLVAAPIAGNADLPTALDVTGDGVGGIWGGRFPQRSADALAWDFAVRIRNGQLTLVPQQALGIASRAAITRSLPGETFEGLREAPGTSTFVTDSAVVLQTGAVYVARSREAVTVYGTGCSQFAKLSPIEVDVATGRTRIAVITNQRCSDPRLVQE